MAVVVELVYPSGPGDFQEQIRKLVEKHDANLVSLAPAHGFAGHYYVVLEKMDDD